MKGSIFNKLYEQKMTEESFSKFSADEAIREFLDMGQTSAFYTSLDSIPDDVICKVSEVF